MALIKKAFTDDFVIPEFKKFTDEIDSLHESGQSNNNGKVRRYIHLKYVFMLKMKLQFIGYKQMKVYFIYVNPKSVT